MGAFSIQLPPGAQMVLRRLREADFEGYVVGGCVRDALMGRVPSDWDITTSALPQQVKAVLAGERVVDTGLAHGTVSVVLEQVYEVTTFRVDGDYTDGRHPDSVAFTRSLREDLARRDFTINAMAYAPSTGLVDAFGGADDLRAGLIRCVGEPERRFDEDALRLMRAARFSAQLGFAIEPHTQAAIASKVKRLALVSVERIYAELVKLLAGRYAAQALRANAPLMLCALPELNAEAYERGVAALEALAALEGDGRAALEDAPMHTDDAVRLALLTHAMSGGAEAAERLMWRLRSSARTAEQVRRLAEWRDTALSGELAQARRALGQLGEADARRLAVFRACLAYSRGEPLAPIQAFQRAVDTCVREGLACSLKQLAVNGATLAASGIAPGRQMGAILRQLLDEVIDGGLPNERAALLRRARELALSAPPAR